MSNIDKEYINPAEYKLSFGNGWNLFVNPDNTLTLANPNGQSVFTNIIAGITPQTIEFMDNNDSEIVHTNLDLEGNKIEIERISDGISSKWSVEVEQEKSIMHARLEVRSKSILTNPQLHVFTVPEGFIGISPDKIQVDYPGWQSWSPAERYGCLSDVLTLPQGMVEPYTPHTGADTLPFSWVTHFFTEEYNGITMGFTTVSDQEGIIETGKRVDNTKIDAWTYMACPNPRYDEITDEWVYTSDEFTLILDQDRNQGLAEYSERIKRQMALTDVVPDLNIGHNRWYIEKQGVTFDSVREIADIIINNPDKYPFTRVEFDDGWQVGKKIGDWQIDGSYKKLPEFIRGLHDKDKNVLIWVAPFILVNSSNAFKKINQDHPEWIVRDTSGKPLIAFENEEWEGDVHVLDLTNEDV
ncbi:MAG TPA: hypothetical protein VK338_04185, partial [Candidatus Nitrosocosmicus sp.]|nr:hypothetical protein [Candidatus Nitrosocosmicus sp.]